MSTDLRARGYDAALSQMRLAPSRFERGRIAREAAEQLGVSVSTIYRKAQAAGLDLGRSKRADKGTYSLTLDQLETVSKLVGRGINHRGAVITPMKQAVRIAQHRGLIPPDVPYSTVIRQLRETGLGRQALTAPEPGISRVSQYPNHVWQVDVSAAVQWYFRDENGRKLELYPDAPARFYVGKLANFKAIRRTIHRYLVTDHYSGSHYCRYYYSGGESAADSVDFLWRAMQAKPGLPLHGVPYRFVFDKGPGFRNAIVQNLLDGLGCKVEFHATQNPKASGSVESRHNHWEHSFEAWLVHRWANDLAELNRWAEQFGAIYNAEEDHSRHGEPPSMMWLTIRPEQLVEPPARHVFDGMAATSRKTGTLDNRLWLRADGRKWEIKGEQLYPRCKVQWQLTPRLDAGIRVWDQFGDEVSATEIEFDKAGFALNARRHVWDDEDAKGSSAPKAPAQRLAAAVKAGTEPQVETDGLFDDLGDKARRYTYLQRQGQEWSPPGETTATEPLIGSFEAREDIRNRLGRRLTADEGSWWRQRIGDGITHSDLERAWSEFNTGDSPAVEGVSSISA